MSRRVVPEAETIWRALADPTRRALLDRMRAGPQTTGTLAAAFPTTRFAVMKHLEVLVEAGLVTVERRGRQRLNHLNPVPLQDAYERWVRPLAAPSAEVALRLAEHAERPRGTEHAEHTEKTMTYGLDVRTQHEVDAGVDRTWAALLELTAWWPRCWPEGARLLFEPRVGGRLGTTFGAGLDDGVGGSLWGVVAELHPGRELAVDGTMGIPGPVVGRWRMVLDPAAAATRVTVEHRVLGEVDDDTRQCFTRGWADTLASLGSYLDNNAPRKNAAGKGTPGKNAPGKAAS